MTEAGIGRVLVASLHQAIADILPTRLEFYENWLNPEGLRHGTVGLAPLHAVLSFLRMEGSEYGRVMEQAGRYSAEWTVASQGGVARAGRRLLPRGLRLRAALRETRRTVRAAFLGSRAQTRVHDHSARLEIRGSIFCNLREPAAQPLCSFYAALAVRFLQLYGLDGEARLEQCRAVGDHQCVVRVSIVGDRPADDPTADGPGKGADRTT